MPETPCLFRKQTAFFLKCAEIDCALESAKKPRTAGLCGQAAGACDCGLLSCAFIERVNKGLKPPKQGMVRRKKLIPKDSFLHRQSSTHADFSNIAHKRRNIRLNGLWRVHTPPQPLNAHTAAHKANDAGKQGAALCGTFESTKNAGCALSHDHLLIPLTGIERYAQFFQSFRFDAVYYDLCSELSSSAFTDVRFHQI